MADLLQTSEGPGRAVETLLRGRGGRTVLLRLPAPAAGGDVAEQMGLAVAGFNDVELGPCVFRKAGARNELLVSAGAVQGVVGSLEFNSAAVLFRTAVGLVVDGLLFEINGLAPVEVAGVAVCYRVSLRAALGW